jgi:nucleoside-diphosphate-sugar epimerase
VNRSRHPLVLVTGANGFVGSNLVAGLLARGYAVRALVRTRSRTPARAGPTGSVMRVDYRNPEQLRAACTGVQTVYHVAARASDWGRRQAFVDANLGVTRSITRAAQEAGVRRIVFISSAVVYGSEPQQGVSEDGRAGECRFPYAETKQECESLLGTLALEAVIVRPGDVVGPGDRLVTAPIIATIYAGVVPVIGSGEALMCYSYISNVVEGIILAGERGRAGQAYNISDGRELTFREYFDAIAAKLGGRHLRLAVPYPVAHLVGVVLEGIYGLLDISQAPPVTRYRALRGSRDCLLSIAKAKAELGYRPDLDLDRQVQAQVDWFLSTRR